tara:strand:- start:799 stop:1680 length:882 start_codon:yes stop_codon:yes gene_type:complete
MIQTNKVHLMDAVEGLQHLPNECADVVLIDPPYNIGKDFGNSKTKMPIEDYVRWADEWLTETVRILKPSGTMYVYGFPEILAHLSVRLDLPKRWLAWHYTNKTVPSSKFWQRSHESIIVAWKNKDQRIFNRDDVREPYTATYIKGYGGDKKRVRPPTKGRFQHRSDTGGTAYTVHDKGALPRDVIKISALAGGKGTKERAFLCKDCNQVYDGRELKGHKGHEVLKHPTQKPFDLTRRLLGAAKVEQGLVVAPFAGSGSELKIAKELGMNCIGFEINPDYIRIANKLLEDPQNT